MSFSRIIILYSFFMSIPLGVFTSCTNYSSTKANTAPPILISIEAVESNNYRIKARAQNPEILFAGYRLYPGLTERDSRNPGDLNQGVECFGGVAQIPNQPFEYIYQITPDAGGPVDGATCRFVANLGPGTFITVRSLLTSLTVSNGFFSFEPSGPSNTLILPAFVPSATPTTQSPQ